VAFACLAWLTVIFALMLTLVSYVLLALNSSLKLTLILKKLSLSVSSLLLLRLVTSVFLWIVLAYANLALKDVWFALMVNLAMNVNSVLSLIN